LVLVGLVGIVPAVSGASGGRRPVWRIQAVQSDAGFAFQAQVAVAQSGRTVIAWDAGDPGAVCTEAVQPVRCGSPSHLRIEAALGRLPGPMSRPSLLAALGTNVRGFPLVAIGGNGTAYVAWQHDKRGDWVIAHATGGRFSAPRRLGIPAGVQLQELAGAGGGRVAAVWLEFHVHNAPAYRYALLRSDGRIGRTVTIGHIGAPLQSVSFAISDKSKVVASWVNYGRRFGARPRVSAVLCTAGGRCTKRETIRFPDPLGQSVTLASALAQDGTATILASSSDPGLALGLQAAVSHRGGSFQSVGQVTPAAQTQVASAVGSGGALTLFTEPGTTAAWSQLTSHGFTPPQVLDQREVGPGLIDAGNARGDVLLAWINAPAGVITNRSYSIHASLGTTPSLPAPQTIAPNSSNIDPGYLAGGIDERGDAIVVWNKFTGSLPRGVFASIAQP
jgi:hypothetical protein